MKSFLKPAVMAAGIGLVSLTAHAAFTANDLYLGFNKSSAGSDYLIDLGQPGAVGVGGSSVVNLSSYVSGSLFNSIFTSPNGVSMGVVGGQSQFPSTYSIYATALRLGGTGLPPIAGSALGSFSHSSSVISSSVSDLSPIAFPTAGNGAVDDTKGWSAHVPVLNTGSFYGDSGVDPTSAMNASGIIYEDLWKATPTAAYSYLGYFSLNLSGATANLTFTPVAAPEPSTGALFCVAGLSWFLLSRKFKLKNA